jgi:hypothetical protein
LITCLFVLPAHAKYSGGTGEPNDPYQIATAADLIALGETPADYDKHFILTADIDLDPNLPGREVFDKAVISADANDAESGFQGTPFTGAFDGDGHTISNPTITGKDYLGIFGQLNRGAEIKNLGLIDLNIAGSDWYVGGLAGYSQGNVIQCYSSGMIDARGYGYVGGLVGWNVGSLAGCHSSVTVGGQNNVGGLVGHNAGGVLSDCYSTGAVHGREVVGGLVGSNYGSIRSSHSSGSVSGTDTVGGLVGVNPGELANCYSTSTVVGDDSVGGLVGVNLTYWRPNAGLVTKCYSTGMVVGGKWRVGGLVGSNKFSHSDFGTIEGVVSDSLWDIETSGQVTSDAGTGKTTSEMQTAKTFVDAGWDFVGETANGTEDIWKIAEGLGYPRLAWEKYSGGTGEPNDPYQIATAADLIALGETPADYDKHFILTADIDLDPNLPGGKVFDKAVIAPVQLNPWDEEETSFTGVFDGKGHVISRLTITGQDDLGLFGQLRGQARNLGVVDANVAGSGGEIGGLAGYVWPDAEIVGCYSSGSVSGGDVGGLVGWNNGALTRCYSTGVVSGTDQVGGLVGCNNGTVIQCCSSGVVSGTHNVGGLVGCEETGYLVQCYSTCVVNGAGWCIGGLVGTCQLNTVTQCYSTGAVRGQNYVGGLIGDASKVIIWDSYWDIESSGQTISAGGTGKTTAEMQTGGTFLMWVSCQNEIVWTIDEGNDYPRLWWERQHGEPIRVEPLSDFLTGTGTEEDPFLIYTPEELNRIGLSPCEWDRHFKLVSDIDLSGFDGKAGRPAFNPIGVCTQVWESHEGQFPHVYLVGMPFAGVFDGNGHTISHLTLKSQEGCAGLFGGLRGGQVKNLGVVDVNIAALDGPVGGLVGHNSGTVTGCYSTGMVSGDGFAGGLVGYSDSSITYCYSAAVVSGNHAVGGLVGYNRYADYGEISIRSCYSTGTGTGTGGWGVGGLVGLAGYGWPGSLTASFWDTQTSGETTSEGGIGKTTAEMQTAKTFLDAGWDFVGETANGTEDIWWILEGKDYPRLWWENAPQ